MRPSMRRILLTLVLIFRLLSSVCATQVCYWPNGNPADSSQPALLPCADSVEPVHCCNNFDACLENGLCWGGSIGFAYRGGCTDKSWSTSKCPNYCNDQNNASWTNLWPCQARQDNKNWWCGYENDGICSTGTAASIFSWPTPGAVTTVLRPATSTTSTTIAISANTNANNAPTSTDTKVTMPTGSAASTSATTGRASPGSASDNSVAVAIGAGVGVPLGVLVVGLLTFLFWRERKKSSLVSPKALALQQGVQHQQDSKWQDRSVHLATNQVGEMSGESPAQEMPSNWREMSQELDGRKRSNWNR